MAKSIKKPITPVISEELKYVKRKITYHDLLFVFEDSFNPSENSDKFLGFFSLIAKLAISKDQLRYQPILDAKIFVQDVKFIAAEKKITGKLRYVKMDVFPELMDIITDETKDIETEENQGLVETTHFIIDYSKPLRKIAIEYNHAGAKISDFITYCQAIGLNKRAIRSAEYRPLTKDELGKLKDRIGTCSMIDFRVHKNDIDKIESLDNKIFSTLKAIQKQYETEYIEIKLKFKYKKTKKPQKIQSNISNIISAITRDKKKLHLFDTLKINALDRSNNFKMRIFDLLIDEIKSEISVQKKPKHKVLLSVDVFDKMKDAMREIKL